MNRSQNVVSAAWRRSLAWLGLIVGLCARAGVANAPSPPVYNPSNGHWYQSVRLSTRITWSEARARAAATRHGGYRGHLATVTSPEENYFIATRVLAEHRAPEHGGWAAFRNAGRTTIASPAAAGGG